jgi:hypothetical protein
MGNSVRLVSLVIISATALAVAGAAIAADQTLPGQGNVSAIKLATASPMVQSAFAALVNHVLEIKSPKLRAATLDAIANRGT